MARIPYTKPHADPKDWVRHLRAKGLVIARPNVAAKKIELIGYERLRIYFISRRNVAAPGKPFRANTTYADIIQIYKCDARLRHIVFEACGAFELAFRNSMSEVLTSLHGSHPQAEAAAFASAGARADANRMLGEIFNNSRDPRARHYRAQYSRPPLPPLWTMKEFMTFGSSVRFYKALASPIRTTIAAEFGLPSYPMMTQWLECLVDLRNICAHHDRLWNRTFQKQPQRLRAASVPAAATPLQKLKAILECLDYMLNQRGIPSHSTAEVEKVLRRYSQIQLAEAGF